MSKFLLFILALAAAMLVVRKISAARRPPGAGAPQTRAAQRILPCALCGLHVPEHEGVAEAERFFCCEDHRRRAR